MKLYAKDPAAILDYKWNWASWLAEGEVIESITVSRDSLDITIDSSSFTDTTVTVWLSGGTVGDEYIVSVLVNTNQDRTDERSIKILMEQR